MRMILHISFVPHVVSTFNARVKQSEECQRSEEDDKSIEDFTSEQTHHGGSSRYARDKGNSKVDENGDSGRTILELYRIVV